MNAFTSSLPRGWLVCLAGRNPLVRISDRLEAVVVGLVVLVTVFTVPVAGAVGTAVYDQRTHVYATQALTRHELMATVTQDSAPNSKAFPSSYLTTVQWAANSVSRIDQIRTVDRLKAGDRSRIWVDQSGQRVRAPGPPEQAARDAVSAAVGLWLAVTAVGAVVAFVVRVRLDIRRYADWERALDDLADDGGRTPRST